MMTTKSFKNTLSGIQLKPFKVLSLNIFTPKSAQKMLNIAIYQRSASQNYNEVSAHISQKSHHPKVYEQ